MIQGLEAADLAVAEDGGRVDVGARTRHGLTEEILNRRAGARHEKVPVKLHSRYRSRTGDALGEDGAGRAFSDARPRAHGTRGGRGVKKEAGRQREADEQ